MKRMGIAVMACLLLSGCAGGILTPVSREESTGGSSSPPASGSTAADTSETDPSETDTPDAAAGGDWLYTDGNRIVDSDGRAVWITGVNWFGYNTGTNAFDGLWTANLESTVRAVADRGFNLFRVPMSVELIRQWSSGTCPQANINEAANPGLRNKTSLEIFDHFLDTARAAGMKVMIDMHSAKTDAMGHEAPVWYSGDITAEDFYSALEWLAERYAENDTVIAYDLKNEPHGKAEDSTRAIWNDSTGQDNWKHVAEQAAARILARNPYVLIVVEGIEIYPKDIAAGGDFSSRNAGDYHYNWWGGNLRGVADFPVDLGKYQDKLVYSPHDYGPAVYQQPWFYDGYTYESLYADCWRDNWMYIHEEETAPLLIGEWGGFMSEPNLTWMTHLRRLISENRLHHTFWCLNANSGDTGGLLLDDFATWDEEKYAFVRSALWQKDGRFVGLSATVPLGRNGLTKLDG